MLKGRPKVIPVKAMLPKAMATAGGLAKAEANSNAAAKQPPEIDESMLMGAVAWWQVEARSKEWLETP